jgi:hypothetical protein
MATKKATENVKDEEIKTEEIAEEQEKKPADAWSETVNVIVPRKPHGEEQQYYICVNDRRFVVPANGKQQALPRPIAEVLVSSLEAESEAEDFVDHIPNRTSENPTPQQIG